VIKISDNLKEELLSTSYLYRGRIINVRHDRVKIPGGKIAFREIVEHPGAVAILAFNDQGKVIMVRQHRQPAGDVLLEIPAGKLDPGEEPLECARREMLEETGLCSDDWQELFSFYPSPGFCDETIYLFKASDLKSGIAQTFDPEENITIVFVSLTEAWEMIQSGEIKDAKTIIALQYAMIQSKLSCQ